MSSEEVLVSTAASNPSFRGKLDPLKAKCEADITPPPVVEPLKRAAAELVEGGAVSMASKTADVASIFLMPTRVGNYTPRLDRPDPHAVIDALGARAAAYGPRQ